MREGVALPAAGPRGTASEADLLARDYVVDVGGCLSRAWELFKGNAGILIGCSVLVYLALVGVNLIPYLSVLLALIFQGPLLGGLWVFYVKKVRNEEAGVRDAFSGFGPRFWHMTLTQLMPALVVIPIVAILAALLVPALVAARHGHTGAGALTPALVVPLGIAFVVFFGLMVYLNTCWLFALPLVCDKGMKFWPALQLSRRVVAKHWWMTLWLLMVCGFLGMIGLVLCLVGVLVTGPVAFAALACHYEKVFGDLASIQE